MWCSEAWEWRSHDLAERNPKCPNRVFCSYRLLDEGHNKPINFLPTIQLIIANILLFYPHYNCRCTGRTCRKSKFLIETIPTCSISNLKIFYFAINSYIYNYSPYLVSFLCNFIPFIKSIQAFTQIMHHAIQLPLAVYF